MVLETSEKAFLPENKRRHFPAEKQEKLTHAYVNESTEIGIGYIPGDETSLRSSPSRPGNRGEIPEIFEETIRINTLDYELYKRVQQAIIDAFDTWNMKR